MSRVRVGVTGHRHLPNPAKIASLVREALKPGPLYTVVSSLAEGADRVVARTILEYDGAELEAVLPLVHDEYLEDFESAESRREFEELLARSVRTLCVRETRVKDQAEREASYEFAGHCVVFFCDVLLAVWDGRPSRGRGGTAEIVAYSKEKGRPVVRVWEI